MTDHQQMGFRALADPTRRNILVMLTARDMSIAEIADNFEMTRAAVKKHLSILHDGGLISVEVRGRSRINIFNPAGMTPVLNWLSVFDSFWDERLSSLQQAIERDLQ